MTPWTTPSITASQSFADSRSSSIHNGEHVFVQGQDVILTANTVVGTRREFYVSLFNPLEYSVLVRLIDYTESLPGGVGSMQSEQVLFL